MSLNRPLPVVNVFCGTKSIYVLLKTLPERPTKSKKASLSNFCLAVNLLDWIIYTWHISANKRNNSVNNLFPFIRPVHWCPLWKQNNPLKSQLVENSLLFIMIKIDTDFDSYEQPNILNRDFWLSQCWWFIFIEEGILL